MTTAGEAPAAGVCRSCGAALRHTFVDLGMSPLANSYVKPGHFHRMEPFYPLHVFVCDRCWLAQLQEFESPAHIFSDYAYFSSFSDSWLDHARRYVEMIVPRLSLGGSSLVVELASNDGYLLQNFLPRGIPVLGVEPAANVAEVAVRKGIPSVVKFFGEATARELVAEGRRADLIIGNNVLAHVPGLNDFVAGMKILLKPGGTITMEFPHLLRLVEQNQFDTIYHEHFSYLSFLAVEQVFSRHGLTLFDVEELPTHGGSLRIYGRHAADASRPVTRRAEELRSREQHLGFATLAPYQSFGLKVQATKRGLLSFLIAAKGEGKRIAGYGAAAKGNTLLNYCGVGTDFLDFVADRSPHKQNCLLPGTRIPIASPERIREARPDYVLILPWNIKDEVMTQLAYVREWGGRFVVPIPEVKVY
jgi:SAM-dependent methyltransferase